MMSSTPKIRQNPALLLISGCLFAILCVAARFHQTSGDYAITQALNSLVNRSYILDAFLFLFTHDGTTVAVIVAVLAGLWCSRTDRQSHAVILCGVVASLGAATISRIFQLALKAHVRPLHDPALHLKLPLPLSPEEYTGWGSFPSDHAALLAGLTLTVLTLSRRGGWIMVGFATLINLCRIYFGIHYTSDVLAGSMLGVFIVSATLPLSSSALFRGMGRLELRRPGLFYGVLFYALFLTSTMLIDIRTEASTISHAVKATLRSGRAATADIKKPGPADAAPAFCASAENRPASAGRPSGDQVNYRL